MLSKTDVKNAYFSKFSNCFISILEEYSPVKRKYILTNTSSFINKAIRKKSKQKNLSSEIGLIILDDNNRGTVNPLFFGRTSQREFIY